MGDCPLKQYCNDDCEECTDKDKSEKIERIAEVFQPIVDNIVECLLPVIKECTHNIIGLWRSVVECYPKKRVVYLSLHHPKKRVRKKNTNRIMRWLNKKGLRGSRE